MQHDLRLRSSEPVDRLIIISNNEQVVLRCCKLPHNFVLQTIDILKLIHENISKTLLPVCQDIRPRMEQICRITAHIIKVDLSEKLLLPFIIPADFPKNLFRAGCRIKVIQIDTFRFHLGNLG